MIAIVPEMGVAVGGVRDYALFLACELQRSHGIGTTFVAASGATAAREPGDVGFRIKVPESRTAKEFARVLDCTAEPRSPVVLVHYVNYGYQKRGVPFWLMAGLEKWKAATPQARIITVFHELYASGRPWQSAWWLSGVQWRLAKRLWNLTDVGLASVRPVVEKILSWNPERHTDLWERPVFSTVGEPFTRVPFRDRPQRLVVFGLAGAGRRVYGEALSDLERAVRVFGVEEIVDIGPRAVAPPRRVGEAPVRAVGVVELSTISEILANSRFGFMRARLDLLGKSTVFAAFCAHGLVSVVSPMPSTSTASMPASNEYLGQRELVNGVSAAELSEISDRVFDRYQQYRLSVLATGVASVV